LRRAVLTGLACMMACMITAGCGYHVAGHSDVLPQSIQTIAVPAFANTSVQYKIGDRITEAVVREMIQRTRYHVVANPANADAVLTGSVVNFISNPTTFDTTTGRASGVQVIVYIAVNLRDKTGKVLYNRPNLEVRERYEISVDPKTYFDESPGAIDRLSRDVAQSVVAGILENF